MSKAWILLPILLPLFGSFVMSYPGFSKSRKNLHTAAALFVIATSLVSLLYVIFGTTESLTLIRFSEGLSIRFAADGAGRVFAAMVAVLYIPTTFYAFEYMKHEGKENRFFGFFLMSFGVVMGIAFSANMMTMYFFYEALTFATLPLVMHAMDGRAKYAGKRYLIYSISGGALVFAALVILYQAGGTLEFAAGGLSAVADADKSLLRVAFLLAFFGFGVKAAVFPLHGWLPKASVAPTPVTALLHAVAVVKSGAFGIIRIIYFGFGTALLAGSWAQNAALLISAITIVYGSFMALRTRHLKRRLAYSTASNLSYIVFGASLMSAEGLQAALIHMLAHGASKIALFCCVGAILYKTGKEYLHEIDGIGLKMPVVMGCFVISGLSLMGVPPLPGFISKWNLGTAAAAQGGVFAYIGMGALILSALLTALYLFTFIVPAFFPQKEKLSLCEGAEDPNKLMCVPLIAFVVLSLLMTVFSGPLCDLIAGLIPAGL